MTKNRNPGRDAEEKVVRALELLQHEWEEIVEWHHSAPGGGLDSMKIDILVLLRSQFAFPLQVKSSPRGVEEHTKRCPHINVLLVTPDRTELEIAQEIKALIQYCYQQIKKSGENN